MHQFCRVAALFLLLFLSINVAAQSYPNTLLWRISGNGLARPSYLYGTIHLTDKRVFNFGDSVYQAIKSADGFALEVNPELFMLAVINQIDKMDPRKIKDILNSTDTLKYRKALSQKLRKPFDEITTHDILKENNKWLQNL
ncbi:MAG TPA: TraB/GumN family protein, partial [Niabella sp.]